MGTAVMFCLLCVFYIYIYSTSTRYKIYLFSLYNTEYCHILKKKNLCCLLMKYMKHQHDFDEICSSVKPNDWLAQKGLKSFNHFAFYKCTDSDGTVRRSDLTQLYQQISVKGAIMRLQQSFCTDSPSGRPASSSRRLPECEHVPPSLCNDNRQQTQSVNAQWTEHVDWAGGYKRFTASRRSADRLMALMHWDHIRTNTNP